MPTQHLDRAERIGDRIADRIGVFELRVRDPFEPLVDGEPARARRFEPAVEEFDRRERVLPDRVHERRQRRERLEQRRQ